MSNSKKRRILPNSSAYLIGISLLYVFIQLITASNYPVFRDEFYYIDCANNLSFGYVDHPPLSIYILAIWKSIFGDSLISIRVLPALSGALLIFLCGMLTESLGGNRPAQILAAISVFCIPAYWVMNSFYSMNSFDILIWAAMFYLLIRIINTENEKLWVVFGIISGMGLMNKISVGYLGLGIFAAMMLTRERKWYLNKFFWLGGVIAVFMFIPYVIWNMQNEFATLEFIRNASEFKNAGIGPIGFAKEQLLLAGPLNFLIWFTGVAALLFSVKLKPYSVIALVYIIIFIFLALSNSKPYYLVPAYPVLLSSGVVFITEFLEKKKMGIMKPVIGVLLILSMSVLLPAVIPVLSPQETSAYLKTIGLMPESGEKQVIGKLPQYFADRFGWKEMTSKAAGVYNSLGDEEKKHAAIYVQNYGEAGAINYYGKNFNLPQALCGHNNHFLWKPGIDSLTTLIIIGGKIEDHLKVFEEVSQVDIIESEFSMPYESGLAVFLTRKPKKPLKDIWNSVKKYI
ncbi:MAG: glycosyltransferase family 39 protein [Ignavibacteria bacterium]|nr:glycosyltransferase family 39 protein [Ignavibacteria bacterium]